jgi:hypothetical protein
MYGKNFIIFCVSSSLPIFFITLSYLGLAYKNNRNKDVPFYLFPIILPLLFGLTGIINYHTEYNFILGGLFGLLLSLIGRFGLDLPKKLFEMEYPSKVHPTAIILYGLIFKFILTPIQSLLKKIDKNNLNL